MRHQWDHSQYGRDPQDFGVYGRRVCTVCGETHRKHDKQNWGRVIGYEWDGDGRKRCTGKPTGHRWGGAGYVCLDCGAIKDTSSEATKCEPKPTKKRRKK
jgi:hypothetical protein